MGRSSWCVFEADLQTMGSLLLFMSRLRLVFKY